MMKMNVLVEFELEYLFILRIGKNWIMVYNKNRIMKKFFPQRKELQRQIGKATKEAWKIGESRVVKQHRKCYFTTFVLLLRGKRCNNMP